MSKGIARLGDKTHGTCSDSSHDKPIEVAGKITTASGNHFVNKRGVARVGDIVKTECGHEGKIITGSGNLITNGKSTARLGDKIGNGPYEAKIVTASPDTFN